MPWKCFNLCGVGTLKLVRLICLLTPSFALAGVPEGFEELFAERRNIEISVIVNDSTFLATGVMSLGRAELFLDDGKSEDLLLFLQNEYVAEDAAISILEELTQGVEDSLFCEGRRQECQISKEGSEEFQYIIIDELDSIRIHIPEKNRVTDKVQQQYIDESRGENALIMHHYLSANSSVSESNELYYINESTLGVLDGYLFSDITLATNDNNTRDSYIYFDELSGNYLSESTRTKFGFTSENNVRTWNATSILDAGEDLSIIEVASGSTNELEYESKSNQPRIYFTTPRAGRLVITRDDGTPVLEKNVSAGQQYISYDELPYGISTLKFEVKAGDDVVYEQYHKIYNINSSNLSVGEWDYFVSGGYLSEQDIGVDDIAEPYIEDYEYNAVAEARVVNMVTEDIMFGLGIINSKEDYFARTAFSYRPEDKLSINGLYGVFEDDSTYWQLNTNFFGLSVNSSQFSDNTENIRQASFANHLFGYGDTREISANYGLAIGNGRGYLSYLNIENQSSRSIYIENIDDVNRKSEIFTAGYTFASAYKSTIDLRASYTVDTDVVGYETDDWSVGFTISVPIGDSGYTSVSMDTDKAGTTDYIASASNSYELSEEASIGVEVGGNYTDSEFDNGYSVYGSLSGFYDNDKVNASGFAYIGNDSSNISASMNSSTIVTSDDVYHTSKKAESYLLVQNSGELENSATVNLEGEKSDFLSVVNLYGNETHAGRMIIDQNELVYPLDNYKEYLVSLDESASDYHNLGERETKASSYRGTVMNLNIDMREVKSYISIFNDIEGNPISSMSCKGRGCVGVEELAEGVFKFRISAGLPFQLQANAQRCLIPSPETFSTQNLGKNFCMPTFEEEGNLRIARGEGGEYYYYVGEFSDESLIENYEASMEDKSLTFIKQEVGERIFLFVESVELLAMSQQESIESLSQYALEETLERPMFVSR